MDRIQSGLILGEIIYRDIQDFEKDDLKEIFLSVDGHQAIFPIRLI